MTIRSASLRLLALILAGGAFGPPLAAGETFWFGADLSYVNEMEDCGARYADGGAAMDPYALFAARGANLARIRLWNDPDWTDYSDLEDVTRSLRRARAAGMALLLDFHYSDDWADGDKQIVPKAWADIADTDDLAREVYRFTRETLETLDAVGLLPEMVQVGNETNGEVMMPPPGTMEGSIRWARNAALLGAGVRAVRDVSAATKRPIEVMLHIAQPENVEPWFAAAAEAGLDDFDLIGISYYRKWSSRSMAELGETIARLRETYDADVMVVETSYPWTLEARDAAHNLLGEDSLIDGYPATRKGQLSYLVDLTQIVIDSGGNGVVYWEPAWVSTRCGTRWGEGSHWENATLFDFADPAQPVQGMGFMTHGYEWRGDEERD